MLGVLFVDDESIIRDGITTVVPWNEIEFDLLATAGSFIEALEAYRHHRPEIVVTDIRMPGRDGLDLVHAIRAIEPRCLFIILSAHADFSYARRAMELGVRQFLLKPFDEDELIHALELVRMEYRMSLQEEREKPTAVANEKVSLALQYVLARFHDSTVSLKRVARSICYTHPDYLSRTFKREVGMGFARYVAHIRIREAERILQTDPSISVGALAERVGFGENARYFSRVFKAQTGVLPSKYGER